MITRKKPKATDINLIARAIVDATTESKNPVAVAIGKVGGEIGGRARASKLSPEKRKEIARIAAQARWKKTDG